MEIRDLFLFLEAGEPSDARLSVAVSLAEQYGAALTALFAPREPGVDLADCYALGPGAVTDVLSQREAEIAQALAPIRAAFDAATAGRRFERRLIQSAPGELAPDLALRARCYDLAILRRPVTHDHPSHRLAQSVALSSGAPCLLVPEQPLAAAGFDRILVAWNGGREAKRALQDGLALLKRARTVRLVTIEGDGESASSTSRDDVLRHLSRHGVEAGFDRIEAGGADAGSILLQQCGAFHADLLIMGAYGHSRTKELVLGGATRTVLAQASLPVLMSH